MAKVPFVILRASEFKLTLIFASAKIGIEESRLRLFLEAKLSKEVTATCRFLSRSDGPIINELLGDDVASFSARYEVAPLSDIAISEVSVKPQVAAVLCRAREIADHIQGESDPATNILAAKAAVLNGDMLLFRRVTQQMPSAGLAEVAAFAALSGRIGFVPRGPAIEGKGGISSSDFSVQRVLLGDEFSPARNAKDAMLQSDLLILDSGDFRKRKAVDKTIIEKGLRWRTPDYIKQIWVFEGLEVWKRHDNSAGEWYDLPTLWSEVERVDFSGCVLSSIGESSFVKCSKLREVILPDAVTEICRRGFDSCSSLKFVNVGGGLRTLGESAFFKCESLIEIVLPDTVAKVERRVFQGCTSLKVVNVGNGLKTLGEEAFSYCGRLIEIVLPDTVTEIGGSAFRYCGSLRVVKVGNGLKTLGE
jgi:hypothetical protein